MNGAVRVGFCLAVPGLLGSVTATDDLETYFVGEMSKLELLSTRVSLADHQITYADGSDHAIDEKRGKILLINLWSKGCVPCKAEMKDLASLQRDLGDDRFEVVALTMEKRSIRSIRKILKGWGAENLQPYGNDPQALARVLYDEGLFTETHISFAYPTTYLVSKSGEILAMREGFLRWDTPEARALITALKNDEAQVMTPGAH